MSDEAAFLDAIRSAPADDAPRLIYADWLDEQGDARAEYVRLAHAVAVRLRQNLPYDDLACRLRELSAALHRGWREAVGRRFSVVLLSFRPEYKIRTIAAVRQAARLGLKEAKDLVEGAPSVVLGGLLLEDAEHFRHDLESGYFPSRYHPHRQDRLDEGEKCCATAIREVGKLSGLRDTPTRVQPPRG
jgi:uncharacterized protein (TIGR02996 family)